MRIEHRLRYDVPRDQVYAMLGDRDFREQVCQAMHVVRADVDIRSTADGMDVRIDMVQHTQGVPSFAKKFIGDETRIVQSESWVAGEGADLTVEIPGKPGHVTGRITLADDGAGTVETFVGEAKVGIPLIGGKLEGLIHGLFVDGMDTEQGVGVRWLART
jgi:hypothetical protein